MSSYDIAVIGAGVIGCSVAYNLQKAGYEVVLIDAGDFASGTSSHCDSVALICDKEPGIDTAQGYMSIQAFLDLEKELGYNIDFHQRGCLYIFEQDSEYEAGKIYVDRQVADGYDMKLLDSKEVYDYEPYLRKGLVGGLWSSVDCTLNPYMLCFALVKKGQEIGMKTMSYAPVTDIRLDEKGAVKSVVTDKGEVNVKMVVNCAGCWAPEIGRMVGIDIPIAPRKGICMISERGNPVVHQKVQEFGYMMSKFDDFKFENTASERCKRLNVAMVIEPTDANNFILGGNRNFTGFDIRTDIEVMQAVAERGVHFFPILKEINCIRTYCGIRPFVPDHLPIVSPVDEIPGYYIAAGHEGDGISLSAITGRLVTQMIKGEKTDIDIAPMNFNRFKGKVLDMNAL